MRSIEPAHRMEVPNERIFRLVCVESIVGDPSVEAPLRRRRSAIALVEAVFLRSTSARALLYARTGPEMARETRALHRKLTLPDRAAKIDFCAQDTRICSQTGAPAMLAVSRRKITAIAVAFGLL